MKIAALALARKQRLAGAGHGCPRSWPQRHPRPVRLRQDDARRPGDPRPLRPTVCRRRRRRANRCRLPAKSTVESRGRQFRLRRSHDETAGERLTVAAVDHSAVDEDTVRQLVACLSPSLLRPLFAVSFRETPRLEWLLSPEFSHEFRAALWRLKWAPPTVEAELRPIYARLRSLETEVATLVRGLGSEESRATAAAKTRSRTRNRRASHFLAQLTDGELVRLQLGEATGEAQVVTRAGDSIAVDSLWSTQRDQVYLSLCLALVCRVGATRARLPLVLDEPFARMDARSCRRAGRSARTHLLRADNKCWYSPASSKRPSDVPRSERTWSNMQSLRDEHVSEAQPQAAEVATPTSSPACQVDANEAPRSRLTAHSSLASFIIEADFENLESD